MPSAHTFNWFWQRQALLLSVNTAIALLLTLLMPHSSFREQFLISNAIGFSISNIYQLLCHSRLSRLKDYQRIVIAVPLGLLLGLKIGAWLGATDLLAYAWQNPLQQWRLLATTGLIAVAASAFILSFSYALVYKTELETERRQAAEAKQAETAAQLALLQAQIEPHFLFNTLANVHSLIPRDAALAQTMLEHLNDYLRASLARTRKPRATLGEELALVTALLSIAKMRLGTRLSYRIEVDEALHGAMLPPLLLQPLVENALEHGIEPAVEGGEIRIVADRVAGKLRLRVFDSGLGLLEQQGEHDGIGLQNIRQRLSSLYGDAARLALYPNLPHGVIAELQLPHAME